MDYESYRAFFGALSNSSCLSIVQLLQLEPHTISELARTLDFAQSRVSHAVARLVAAGIVECRHDGRRKLYALKDQSFSILASIDYFLQGQNRASEPGPSRDSDWEAPRWISAARASE